MASIRKTTAGKFELRVRNRLLPRDLYYTFETEPEAERYGAQLDALLKAGVVPPGLLDEAVRPSAPSLTIGGAISRWIATGKPARADRSVLDLLAAEVGAVQVSALTYAWCEAWLRGLKLDANLAPGTIRKRIGALSRCIDWLLRGSPDVLAGNPLRLLPRGAAAYNEREAEMVRALGKAPKSDAARERRLLPGEEARIRAALAGEKRADRERALGLPDGPALALLFDLILHTGLRLREAYRLRRGQVDLEARVIRAQSSKQWYGRVAFRDVPIAPALHATLAPWLAAQGGGPESLLLPLWDGASDGMARTTSRLSGQFRRLFAYAQCPGLTEHDLRHEATCRWFEMRDAAGAWLWRPEEINRIMGWSPSSKMAARYASFRGQDLAARMWA